MRVAREVRPPFFRCGISSAVFFVCGVFCFCIISALILDRVGSRKDAKTQRRREGEKRVYREAMRREGGIAAGGKGGE